MMHVPNKPAKRSDTVRYAFIQLSSSSSLSSISYADLKATPAALPALLKAGQHMKVDDFDAHLEDIGALWLRNENVDLNLGTVEESKGTQKAISEK
jgi:hypothetical protein